MKYFGTDGIRREGDFFLKENFPYRLARGVAETFPSKLVVVGRDTRTSGEEIYQRVVNGFCDLGFTVYMLGVVPTPEVCYFCRDIGAVGVIVSASHNPPCYNGIKIVGVDGLKISETEELSIEAGIDNPIMPLILFFGERREIDGKKDYVDRIIASRGKILSGEKVLLDCAHGATCEVAEEIFTRLGADVKAIANTPNGDMINVECGATYMGNVLKCGDYDIAFSFDGDGDRVMCARHGEILDGDDIIYALALAKKPKVVAVTKMSNQGLINALSSRNIETIRVDVGDKFVQDAVMSGVAEMGAEQSGHIIMSTKFFTGDGIAAAVEYLIAQKLLGYQINFAKLPQCLINFKADWRQIKDINITSIVAEIEGKGGRVLIRPSGTEPLVRVLVELDGEGVAEQYALKIASILKVC